MEKQTRVSKYKELRDEMKEEVAINQQVNDVSIEEDDDFLAFLPKEEKKTIEDTLMEPLSYETLDHDNEDVLNALNEAKVNVGKEKYNTRLDILNKIKQDSHDYIPAHGQDKDIQKSEDDKPQMKMSLLEKLAAMSPEEDAEELKKYEEELTVEELMKQEKKKNRQTKKSMIKDEKPKVETYQTVEISSIGEDDDEVEEEGESKLIKVLNYVIVIFIIFFIVLVGIIVKQLLF